MHQPVYLDYDPIMEDRVFGRSARQVESTQPGSVSRKKHFLLASDFDQTLSFNDTGVVLSEMLGLPDFEHKVQGLANSHLVQQGGEF